MKFLKYMNEKTSDISEIIYIIEKDCKPFIDDWKKLNTTKWLMSGRMRLDVQFEKYTVRDNRTPRDTPVEIHNMVDDWFYKKFGIKARSNALFVTFNPNMTYRFGMLYLIFPIGNYKVVSSNSVGDLYDVVEYAIKDIMGKDFNMKIWDKDVEENDMDKRERVKSKILKKLESGKYTDKLFFHNNEIMLSCKEYYIVDKEYNKDLLEHFNGW